jgi:hypothetical protein
MFSKGFTLKSTSVRVLLPDVTRCQGNALPLYGILNQHPIDHPKTAAGNPLTAVISPCAHGKRDKTYKKGIASQHLQPAFAFVCKLQSLESMIDGGLNQTQYLKS